mgnify:CR=1 FL=1
MTQAQSKSYGGVKKKLMGAICMLLVASIMMVSSTYAWFTLSTAPEITGISTSVGANGNLEMALLNTETYADLKQIESTVGSSKDAANMSAKKANVTWGNLVDLSEGYGLDQIKLMPARLSVTGSETGGYTINTTGAEILVAEYGTDGRVTALSNATVSGILHTKGEDDSAAAKDSATGFYVNEGKGVRALGTASGMSQQQLAYRNAQGYVATYTAQAKNYAQQSLVLYGSDLANVALKHVNNTKDGATDNEEYTLADVTAVNNMIDMLANAQTALQKALMYSVLGEAASKTGSETAYEAVQNAIAADDASINTVKAAATGVTLSEDFNTAETTFSAIAIPDKIDTAGKATFTWNDISTAVSGLADTSKMNLNGQEIAGNDDLLGNVVNEVLGGKGLTVTAEDGSGVYVTIAKLTGNYSAKISIEKVSFGGFTATNVTATMATNTATTPAELQAELAAIVAMGAPEQAEGAEKAITDTYAYAIDMAFRTNAGNNAKLMLQTEAAQRIYDGSDVQDTQGGGSNFTFTAPGLTSDAAKSLAENVVVVFASKEGKILGVAGLDTAKWPAATETGEYKVNLVMKSVTWESDDCTLKVAGNATDNTITTLTQNEAMALTAYVYLNGDSVDNGDVAANAAASMIGTLNLQFSTDQKLVPMDYTPLKQAGGSNP